MEDNSAYFERRAIEETVAAEKAEHPKARDAHVRMARYYQDFARAGEPR